ncbi:MAG: TlpA disulfide reductase family protein [Chloroflexi bacterium]|nr:TlpA disulfide reductase family protein [Chloroflexota bacterium]
MSDSLRELIWRAGPLRLALSGAGVVLAVLLVALGVAMFRGVGDSPLGETAAGFEHAPAFAAETLDGETHVIGRHGDGPLFVYFWASWCAPCESEAPLIQALWPEYEARGYTFVGVNVMDNRGDADAFAARHGLTFPVLRGGEVYLEYGVSGLPEAFFLRPGLEVSRKYVGELREAEFRAMLDRLAEGA